MIPQPGVIILKKEKIIPKSESGIILDSAKAMITDNPIAVIVAHCPKDGSIKPFEVDTKVIYNKYGGIQILHMNNEEYIIGDENIVQVILNDDLTTKE